MDSLKSKAIIFGKIFTISNRLQLLGDKLDNRMTVKQWLLVTGILNSSEENPTLSEVARIIGSSRQNVKKLLLILEKQGFVLLNKDERDARAVRVSLTDACRRHLEFRNEMETGFIGSLFDGMDEEKIESLKKSIEALEKNINEMEKEL